MELRHFQSSISYSSLWFVLLIGLALYDTRHQFQAVSSSEIYRFPSPNSGAYDNPEYDDPRHHHLSLESLFPLETNGLELESYKRSSAFFPLRGKKPSQSEDFYDELDSEMKRGSHFFPLRGKKLQDELKRASSFMPMRGRKDDTEISTHDDDKRASFFMPMRGKKSSEDSGNLQISGTYHDDAVSDFNQITKRKSAFMSVRGRKGDLPASTLMSENARISDFISNIGEVDHRIKKRSPSLASSARSDQTRGVSSETKLLKPGQITTGLLDKKHYPFMQDKGRNKSTMNNRTEDWELELIRSGLTDDSFMKGDNSLETIQEKRASSFMPMRGRRVDEIAFPLPESYIENLKSSSSLMPMRGHIMDNFITYGDPWAELGQDLKYNPEPMIAFSNSKRPSYFMPMRGRRRDYDGPGDDSSAFYGPYPYLLSGIGSSLMRRPYGSNSIKLKALRGKTRRFKINWDSVKRAFHAARGKRVEHFVSDLKNNYLLGNDSVSSSTRLVQDSRGRMKRSLRRSQLSLEKPFSYIALKRKPISFFATRGKRLDISTNKMRNRR